MKTQIIQLETHDDAVSVRDKMGWGQAARIVLVWPVNERMLSSRLDLTLLQRHSSAMGIQLALVSSDPEVRYNARKLQIPVFKSLRKAQSSTWRVGRRKLKRPARQKPRPDLEAMRSRVRPVSPPWYAGQFARRGYYGFTLVLALAVAGLLSPGARITLLPESRQQQISLAVSASPDLTSPNLSGGVPIRLERVVVEGRLSKPATGSTLTPEKAATGSVRFTNLTDRAVSVPAGTIVATRAVSGARPVRFATTREVRIPAAAGKSVSVQVGALQPGEKGNVPAGSLETIEGGLGLSLSVVNPQRASGGSSLKTASPARKDYDTLYAELLASLKTAALEEALAGLPPGSMVVSPVPELIGELEKLYSPPPNSPGEPALPSEQLTLTLRLEFEVQVVSGNDIQNMAVSVLNAALPPGFLPSSETIKIQHAGKPSSEDGRLYQWGLMASRPITALVLEEQVIRSIRGLKLEQAANVLSSSLNLSQPPEIKIDPAWWPRLPLVPFRLEVELSSP